ncbi:TolC family protein [Geopsychrobacter electrodiphilus]|uniref:TolC family protein n=1 Tax=Geopsychrobacter electrodiphilus TaxID=225196 RepID=UPI000372C8C7|nr:TolC family protein [Geopsychrobacter electrodiphilus]
MSKCFFRIFLFLAPFLTASVTYAAPSSDSVDLSLKTAIAMAIRNNLDLRVDALSSSISATTLQQSRGIYDPSLSISVSHDETFYTGQNYGTKATSTNFGVTQNLPSGGNLTAFTSTSDTTPLSDPGQSWKDWYSSAGITLNQPLLKNFGKESTELSINLAANNHEASIEQYRDSVIATVYAVIRGYNRLYTLHMILKSRETAFSSAQKLLTTIKQSKNNEQQSIELANTRYAISQRLNDLVDADQNISDQEAKLRYLIGVKKRIKLNPVDLPSTEEPMETTEQAIALAMENGFNLKQLRLDLKSSELQERMSKQSLWPDLSLTTSVGFRGIESTFDNSIQQIGQGKGRWWSAGLQFSMPLGNTVAKSTYLRDKLFTQQTRNRINAAEWQLRDSIETDMRTLTSARVQRQVAEKSVTLSEQRIEQYRQSVARKTSKVQDLLNAENDLVFAKVAQAQAMESFSNSVALLWRDAGVLLERENIHVNIAQPEELTLGTQDLAEPAFTPRNIKILATESDAVIEKPTVAALPLPAKTKRQPDTNDVVKPLVVATPKLPVKKSTAQTALYTLRIGEYVSSELETTRRKVKEAGLTPLITTGTKQPRTVFRLRVGDYSSLLAAKTELLKVKNASTGGFILNRGKAGFRLYAGSYFSQQSAKKGQRRLTALGLATTLDEVEVMLPTSLLTAGPFPTHDAALEGALKLKKLGVTAVVSREN